MSEPKSAHVISYNHITKSNFDSVYYEITKRLNFAFIVAIDLEFTAISTSKPKDMNQRYASMKALVESAAIASIGLSILKHLSKPIAVLTTTSSSYNRTKLTSTPKQENKEAYFPSTAPPVTHHSPSTLIPSLQITATTMATSGIEQPQYPQHVEKYEVDNFNLLVLKQGSIKIETDTGDFLLKHGFSIDEMYRKGIPFVPPSEGNNESIIDKSRKSQKFLKDLWKHMMNMMRFHHVPLIIHNGLYDLMYIYHSFIGALPDTIDQFTDSISNCFPSGIYDTKYLAKQTDYNATFLAYVFGKSDRLRQDRFLNSSIFEPYFELIVNRAISDKANNTLFNRKRKRPFDTTQGGQCKAFRESGYCRIKFHIARHPCHDVQLILDDQMGLSKYAQVYTSKSDFVEGAHTAHFDAYMTAFSYCFFKHTFTPIIMEKSMNKINLSGLGLPLWIPIVKDDTIPKKAHNI